MKNTRFVRANGYGGQNYQSARIYPRPYSEHSPSTVDFGFPPDLLRTQTKRVDLPPMPEQGQFGDEDNLIGRIVSGIAERMFLVPGAAGGGGINALMQQLQVYDRMRYAEFRTIPFTVGAANAIILPKATTKRVFLYVENNHATQDFFIDWDQPATPVLSENIPANGGFHEWLFVVPQNQVNVISTAGGTTGVMVVAELPEQAPQVGNA